MGSCQWSGLRAEMGFTAVLHSWGERLNLHPHLHCLVPGGGVSLDNDQWVDLPRGFFLPRGRLRITFRDTYLKLLERAYERCELKLVGEFYELRCPEAFAEWVARLRAKTWITHDRPLVENGGGNDPAAPEPDGRLLGSLCQPRGDRQQPFDRAGRWRRPVLVQGLPRPRSPQDVSSVGSRIFSFSRYQAPPGNARSWRLRLASVQPSSAFFNHLHAFGSACRRIEQHRRCNRAASSNSPGIATESVRYVLEVWPEVDAWEEEAEPRIQCVPRQSPGTRGSP